MEVGAADMSKGNVQPSIPQKRSASASDIDDEEDVVDRLLPANTMLKRRRLKDEANGISQSFDEEKSTKKGRKTPPKKPVDIKEVVRERRKAAEKAAEQEHEEDVNETLEDMTVEEMKRLAVVEEIDVPNQRKSAAGNRNGANDRWDERWQGRKDFKGFRRKGENSKATKRGPSIIVPLEEAKTKAYGIRDSYWPEEDGRGKKKDRGKESHISQSHSQPTRTASASGQRHTAELPADLVIDDGDSVTEVIDVDAPRATTHQQQSSTQQTENPSSHSKSQSMMANGKRPNPGPSGPPVVKRRKKFAAAQYSDDD